MKRPACPTTPPGAFRRALWILSLALLLATTAMAELRDIDIDSCPSTIHEINLYVGDLVSEQDIGVIDATANVFWDLAAVPTDPECTSTPTSFKCNDVTVTLPSGSPGSVDPSKEVAVSGTPTEAGAFRFKLQVTTEDSDFLPTCAREYDLIIKRHFDIAFVLDRSGSMADSSKVSPPATTRWEALRAGVKGTNQLIAAVADTDSNFGLTLFESVIIPNPLSTLTPIGSGLAATVDQELGSQTPLGGTGMGAGLQDGLAKLTDTQRQRVVIVLTDGEQNVTPEVTLDGCTFTDGTLVNPTCPAQAGDVKIVTIGIGGPEGDYLTTLQNLATNNLGTWLVTGDGTSATEGGCTSDPAAAFGCVLQSALAGSGLQMVQFDTRKVETPVVTLPSFDLNQSLEQLLIQFSVDRNFDASDFSSIVSSVHILKNGSDITADFQPQIVGDVTNAALLQYVFPGDSSGTYKVEIHMPAGISPPLEYRVTTFVQDNRLTTNYLTVPSSPQVGEPFRPTAELSWMGSPVTNANVKAFILEPGADLGDLLARDPRKAELQDTPEAGSPGLQKYRELLKDPAFQNKLKPKEKLLVLKHQGGGVYSAPYTPEVSGVYQIRYEVKASNRAFGKLDRVAVQSVFVRPDQINLAASAISTTAGNGTVTIKLRPKTKTGRFVGPANASAISVTSDTSNVRVRQITDHQDGSYTILLDGDPVAEVSIKLLGDEIYRGPLGNFGAGR